MRRSYSHVAAVTSVLAVVVAAFGCTSNENHGDSREGVSTVSLPLVSMNAAGDTFVLENVHVDIRQGMTLVTSLVGNDMDPMETLLSADLAAGAYTAELAPGWRLMQVQPDDSRVEVAATLRGSPVQSFTVQNDATITLVYVFESDGGPVGFGGSVQIGFVVEEPDDGGPVLPDYDGPCPVLATGTVNVLGQNVQLWVGAEQPEPGPILFYWHGTLSTASEAQPMLGGAFADILSRGGMIASFMNSTQTGTDTSGTSTWFSGDFEMADILVACAAQQLNIDTRRIYTAGCSAGGLHAGAMTYDRSSYLAGAMPNSGGLVFPRMPQDSHVPSVITAHGSAASDVVIISFAEASATLYNGIADRGGYATNCDHGGGHCGSPPALKLAQWQYLLDHPFGVSPDPYPMGLPASFPSYCTTIAP